MQIYFLYKLYIYMTQGNNIKLNIEKSLSYTIDKQLDSELNTDVKLNYNQWKSVFDIIKNAEDNKSPEFQKAKTRYEQLTTLGDKTIYHYEEELNNNKK